MTDGNFEHLSNCRGKRHQLGHAWPLRRVEPCVLRTKWVAGWPGRVLWNNSCQDWPDHCCAARDAWYAKYWGDCISNNELDRRFAAFVSVHPHSDLPQFCHCPDGQRPFVPVPRFFGGVMCRFVQSFQSCVPTGLAATTDFRRCSGIRRSCGYNCGRHSWCRSVKHCSQPDWRSLNQFPCSVGASVRIR